jgi:hypothetical protein
LFVDVQMSGHPKDHLLVLTCTERDDPVAAKEIMYAADVFGWRCVRALGIEQPITYRKIRPVDWCVPRALERTSDQIPPLVHPFLRCFARLRRRHVAIISTTHTLAEVSSDQFCRYGRGDHLVNLPVG